MKTIIVTGGAGFLGSNLCKRLINDGDQVICIDNLFTGKERNITSLRSNKRFRFIKEDIEDRENILNKVKSLGWNPDLIYNLACPASPPAYQLSPTKTIRTNVIGMINMLELARQYGAIILQASTSEVYGDPLVHPQPESYRGNVNPIGIRACYDEGKRCAEALCFDYNREFGVPIKVIRIFNTYGPNMDPSDGRVISNFILQALNDKDITIYGDGTQTRSFCYVDDLIEGMVRMMESNKEFLGPVNLGNPGEFTMVELAGKIIEMTASHSKLVHLPLPLDDPTQRKPIIEKARRVLGWSPKVNLDEGLLKTIEFYRELRASQGE